MENMEPPAAHAPSYRVYGAVDANVADEASVQPSAHEAPATPPAQPRRRVRVAAALGVTVAVLYWVGARVFAARHPG